jgi:hypothetical protein
MTGFLDARFAGGGSATDNGRQVSAPDRSSPISWVKRRREDREIRKAELARGRATNRLARLGPDWKLIDVAEFGLTNPDTFLAIGPGGLFAVSVKNQGRTRVRLAGDVVQLDGRRPTYVAEARKVAKAISEAISTTAGQQVPIMPVVAFAGTGPIDVHGVPRGVVITSYRELDHLLRSYGERISRTTVAKLYAMARHPVTWVQNQVTASVGAWHANPSRLRKQSGTA